LTADGDGAGTPILNLVGERVGLGPRRRDLLPLYLKWINDFEVTRTLATPLRPMTWEEEEAWYDRAAQNPAEVGFTIYERETLRPIGNTGLASINHRDGTAEFGILIGEKDCWGKGYGTEATRLMLDYAFTALGLGSLMLRVFSHHERAIRCYTRAGFKPAGRLRRAHHLAGVALDVVYMDCLAEEFESPVLRKALGVGTDSLTPNA
jgi:RimJ/RimL family protein N-acetyltransferase